VLNGRLDFDTFLTSTLVAEVQKKQPGYSILRRRIAILIGQWVTVKIASSNRVTVYQIFQHILDKDDSLNDLVVRITAGKQFKNVIDDWDFEVDLFVPYLPGTLGRIMALIEEVELTETKIALLSVVAVAVERLGHYVSLYFPLCYCRLGTRETEYSLGITLRRANHFDATSIMGSSG
jgi:hypothetical protein